MISFDTALSKIVEAARPLEAERIALTAGHGRVLAKPVVARLSAPACDVSTMDGYALRTADVTAGRATFRVIGESRPGAGFGGVLRAGSCVRTFTGAPIPRGADRVVIQEDVARNGDDAMFAGAPSGPRHIRAAASDFCAGDVLLDAGILLGPRQLVAAAAGDAAELVVWRRPRLSVLSTGDELTQVGHACARPGAIPDSISWGIQGLCDQWGGQFSKAVLIGDDLPRLEAAAGAALESSDVVVVTGGASVGERDFARRMFEPHGLELIFAGVAMKPGKPVWFGRAGGTLVLGLPGNPTSAMVTGRLFLAPLLVGMTGRDPTQALRWRREKLAHDAGPVGTRETFARGTREGESVRLSANQDSGAQAALAASELLVRLPSGPMGPRKGELVDVLDF